MFHQVPPGLWSWYNVESWKGAVSSVKTVRVRLEEKGRILLPSAYRQALDVKPRDELVLSLEGAEVHVMSKAEAIRRVQDAVCAAVGPDRLLSEELSAQRQEEAKLE